MKPVYFPFTLIEESTALAIKKNFGSACLIYQASETHVPKSLKKVEENGLIEICTPESADDQRLDAVLREYRQIADLHGIGGLSFLKTRKDEIPFFNDSSKSQIRANILRKSSAGNSEDEQHRPSQQKTDPLFAARIFLLMAQEFDIEQQDTESRLNDFADMEKDLMKNLTGGDEPESGFIVAGKNEMRQDDTAAYMTAERISAWTRLLCLCPPPPEDKSFYITDSRVIVDYVLDRCEDAFMAATIKIDNSADSDADQVENRAEMISGYINALADDAKAEIPEALADETGGSGPFEPVFFSVHVIPERQPESVFSDITDLDFKMDQGKKSKIFLKNTVIVLAEN
ncbi:hypothetical protein QUF76_05670 [Desulfobacterales bacterium HSG16]|nr:hypothetical protein [Desulfobacterales bacterium HSG16]